MFSSKNKENVKSSLNLSQEMAHLLKKKPYKNISIDKSKIMNDCKYIVRTECDEETPKNNNFRNFFKYDIKKNSTK